MKLSEFVFAIPRDAIRLDNIWVDGRPYDLDDDGDTLIPAVETDEQRCEREKLIQSLEKS